MDADVAVIGYGPAGMTAAALLGKLGHRVVVLERYPGLYNLPRAGGLDDETVRTLDALGVAQGLLPRLIRMPTWELHNGAGQVLAVLEVREQGRSGWADMYTCYQPDLEDALDATCRALPSVEVRQGVRVVAVHPEGAAVRLEALGPDGPCEFTAAWVLACDGGESTVRGLLGVEADDAGFAEPHLVCDFELRREIDLPRVRQICDPAQPRIMIYIGPRHYRFAFTLRSPDEFALEATPESVWAKVAPSLTPDDAELIRIGQYVFRASIAERWRVGRVLLLGDAAHQMPPFLAQGMCSGIRDAQNLAFKLDLVLTGRADADLLDSYQSEREPHVRWITEKAVERGRAITARDPELAALRDQRMLAARAVDPAPVRVQLPGIGPGFLARESGPGRGDLSHQGFVDDGTGRRRLDDVIGHGFHLLATAPPAEDVVAELRRAGVTVAVLGETPGTLADCDGTYRRWFAELGVVAVAVRPDFYVYGTASDSTATDALARELLDDLGSRRPAAVASG
ncbi:MAG: bifunctional 3-(3-hydroxy-phenyl)propionate/3-hydroxycinnamic acid hydroxylase [Sporichthyaceae bacterium]